MSNYSQIQGQKVSSILVQCFIDDPSFDFILGDYGNKIDVLNAFFQLFVADAMQRGHIAIAPEEQGACLWYPADVEIFNEQFEQSLIELVLLIAQIADEESGKRFEHLIQKLGAHQPQELHCEVFFIGLQPSARGKGIGKGLLKPVLDYADATQVGCYLVSSNSRNLSFYERQGFQPLYPIHISDSYSMTGMWRTCVN